MDQPSHHDKWIATIIWIALLFALTLTSYYAWQTSVIISDISDITTALSRATPESDLAAEDVIDLIAIVFLSGATMMAWWRFAAISLDILQAFAIGESPFEHMFIYPLSYLYINEENEDEPLDPLKANSTSIGGVIKQLAYVWAFILLIPPITTVLVQILDQS